MTAVIVVNDGVSLAGTLALPPTDTPCGGGVVMIGGSGPADRDNDGLFPPIRRHLVNAGDDLPLSSPIAGQPPPPRGRTATRWRYPRERATCLTPTSAWR